MTATHLVLVGLMGSGKSSVSRRVAQRLGCRAVDLDAMVEARAGCTIAELFADRGEETFRDLEAAALAQAVAESAVSVIATGGGVVVRADTRRALREAPNVAVVWLDARPEVLATRVAGGTTVRPLLADDPLGVLQRLDALRRPWYAEVADHHLDTASRSLDDVTDDIVTWWRSLTSSKAGEESS